MSDELTPPSLVDVTRGERVESRHRGAIAVCAPDGRLLASAGDPETFVYARSAAKPFQLAPFVASGHADALGLGPRELALMSASHSGEDQHTQLAASLLARVGRDAGALGCGVHEPYDGETADRLIREGIAPTALHHNCSGKHSGMVLFADRSGWPTDGYWESGHPVQQAIRRSMAAASGLEEEALLTAVDGCGVPTFGMPLRALATAFARLADPGSLGEAGLAAAVERIRDAMIAHPELVAGENRRLDTALMRTARPRIAAKAGAEGIQGVAVLALPSGAAGGSRTQAAAAPFGVAVVIEDGDGARRGSSAATCQALHQLGALDDEEVAALGAYAAPRILDPRGEVAGSVVPAFSFG